MMGINRVEDAPFAQIANSALRDQRLSFRARGILAMVLSNVGEWQATREWIARQSEHEGRQAIQTALNELTTLGYRRVHKERGPDGGWVTVTSWYHTPPAELVQESADEPEELVQESTDTSDDGERTCPVPGPSSFPTVGFLDVQKPVRLIEHHSKNTIENTIEEQVDDEPPTPPTTAALAIPEPPGPTEDIERIVAAFSESLTDLGVKHTTTDKWRNTIRLMLTRDKRTPDEILGAIRWAHSDNFWCSVIHSPTSLRAKFDQMKLQAQRRNGNNRPDPVQQGLALAAHYRAQGA